MRSSKKEKATKEGLTLNENVSSPLNLAPHQFQPDKVPSFLGICHEGWPWVGLAILVSACVGFFLGVWACLPGIVTLWVAWFFRDPRRAPPQVPGAVLAPADGTVIEIGPVHACPWFDPEEAKKYFKVSIFMSIFNVHVNRIPCKGFVKKLKYNPGKFFSAFKEKASLENEQMAIWLEHGGASILIVQIAGLIARRIVCRLTEGEAVEAGAKFGLIRFGSRMDVYYPQDMLTLDVKKGDKVKGGLTILARPR